MAGTDNGALQRLLDKDEIYETICRYARGVDRGDEALIRSAYHTDAYDDHVDYKGDIDGFVAWLDTRFVEYDNSMHFLGNCLIEFANADLAMAETSFASRRLRAPIGDEGKGLGANDMICRQAWGRYLDRFERRDGAWKVARRIVVIDSRFTTVAIGGAKSGDVTWGSRSPSDPVFAFRKDVLGDAAD